MSPLARSTPWRQGRDNDKAGFRNMTTSVRKGLFRTVLPGIGECARVDMRAGDAAPYLEREMYVMLGFQPAFETLARKDVEQAPPSRMRR